MKENRLKKNIVMLFAVLALSAAPLYSLNSGDSAPLVNIKQRGGGMFMLSHYRNKKHVIMSFFHHECLPCISEIVHLQKLKKAYRHLEVVLVADVETNRARADAFLKKVARKNGAPLSLKVGMDRFGDAKNDYHVKRHPTIFLISKSGRIVYTATGYNANKACLLDKEVRRLCGD